MDEARAVQSELYTAARSGDRALLFIVASEGHADCIAPLLAPGADLEAASMSGWTPLMLAARNGHVACVEAVLRADPLVVANSEMPAHAAAEQGLTSALQQLLTAGPAAALHQDAQGRTPLAAALDAWCFDVAHYLLAEAPLPKTGEVLKLLAAQRWWAEPLYAALMARQRLTAAEWDAVPSPCAGLATALPAVLGRSTDDAALLLRHLRSSEPRHVRAALLCLLLRQRRPGISFDSALQVLELALAEPSQFFVPAKPSRAQQTLRSLCNH
ncbi:hypothetical protein ABPG75_004180 [Micractinium tetrahymenae]